MNILILQEDCTYNKEEFAVALSAASQDSQKLEKEQILTLLDKYLDLKIIALTNKTSGFLSDINNSEEESNEVYSSKTFKLKFVGILMFGKVIVQVILTYIFITALFSPANSAAKCGKSE
ncbi:hypothetical protein CKF54_03980 [Psittacicella hinzii]|uniref:Uncharacterized protein n=1 Tax=Psittacicella hinzii TaxID=2028575 RepID=A0A3A1Y6E3_9GAMM|nr:hypothetical protein [Psittacicella hinzii]RIY32860.1 hypothetical protein CKF54_03980 [Psittacicella hinzii]